MSDCYTIPGIQAYLTSLEGLHQLIKDYLHQREVGTSESKLLKDVILYGRWSLGRNGFGSVQLTQQYKPVSQQFLQSLAPVVEVAELRKILKVEMSITFNDCMPPPADTLCSECGLGWTLDNITDFVGWQSSESKSFRHKRCHSLIQKRDSLAYYQKIITAAGFADPVLSSIPNGYCPCERCEPWVLLHLPAGDVTIGWRKRVIHIDWRAIAEKALEREAEQGDYKQREVLREKFSGQAISNDDVTRDLGLIHAWGNAKAIEYLTTLRLLLASLPPEQVCS